MPLLRDTKPELEIRSVSLSYEKERSVLRNMSFRIEPEETVALVGLNGSGKSTMRVSRHRSVQSRSGLNCGGGCATQEVSGRAFAL